MPQEPRHFGENALMGNPIQPRRVRLGALALILAAATACGDKPPAPASSGAAPAAAPAAVPAAGTAAIDDEPIPPTPSPLDALPEAVRELADKPFTEDLDAMVKRRMIRVGVTFNRTHYFIDKGQERGATYESLKLFENDLNRDLKTGKLKVHVAIVPMPRDQLYPALVSGKVDMVAA